MSSPLGSSLCGVLLCTMWFRRGSVDSAKLQEAGFATQLCHCLILRPWMNYSNSMGLAFSFSKQGAEEASPAT